MDRLRISNRVTRSIVLAWVILLLLMAGFQALPLSSQSDASYINAAGLQRTRCEVFAKSVLILAYRSAAEKPQALSDIEVALPIFEQENLLLLESHDSNVQLRVIAMQGDYLAMITALHAIIEAKDTTIDPTQVTIVLMHDRAYLTAENQLVTLLQQEADARTLQVFIIETIIGSMLLAIALIAPIVSRRILGFRSNKELLDFVEQALSDRGQQRNTSEEPHE